MKNIRKILLVLVVAILYAGEIWGQCRIEPEVLKFNVTYTDRFDKDVVFYFDDDDVITGYSIYWDNGNVPCGVDFSFYLDEDYGIGKFRGETCQVGYFSGKITVNDCYAFFTIIIRAAVVNKGHAASVTYSPIAINLLDVNGLFTIDTNAGEPTYTLEGGTGVGTLVGNNLTVTVSGTFIIGLTTAETENYTAGEKVYAILTVNKANPTYTVPIGLTATFGDLLSSVALPSGWSWDDEAVVGNAGAQTHKATFTPSDTENFNIITDIDVTMTISPLSITSAAIAITPPVTGASPDPIVSGVGFFTGSVSWEPNHNQFQANTAYTATVTLTRMSENYTFSGLTNVLINENSEPVISNDGNEIMLKIGFDNTGAATIIGIEIIKQPAKLTYIHGETLDLSGMEVRLTYNDLTYKYFAFEDFADNHILTAPVNGVTLSRSTHNGLPVTVSSGGQNTATYNLTVNPKPITIIGVSATDRVYDRTIYVELTGGELQGVVATGNVGFTLGRGTVDNVNVENGKSVTTNIQLTGAAMGNYTLIQPNDITVNITPRPITINGVSATNRAYDGTSTIAINGGTLVGVIDGDQLSPIIPPTGTMTNAGVGNNKPVTVGNITLIGAAAGNYILTQPTGITVNITPRIITITGFNIAKVYDGNNNVTGGFGNLTFNGLVGGETAHVNASSVSATFAGTDAGHHNIAFTGVFSMTGGNAISSNYTIVQPTGITGLITRAELTIIANDFRRQAGKENPPFSARFVGFVNNENSSVLSGVLQFSTTATVESPLGEYPINVSGVSAINYDIRFLPGTLTVIAQPILNVWVEDVIRYYGDDNPPFIIRYSGFDPGEDERNLISPPQATTSATRESPPGRYDIILSGGLDDKYIIDTNNSHLYVEKALLTVTAHNKFRLEGMDNPELTFSYSGFKLNDDWSILENPPVIYTNADLNTPPGTVPIRFTGGEDSRYNFEFHPAVLTILPSHREVTYGDPPFFIPISSDVQITESQILMNPADILKIDLVDDGLRATILKSGLTNITIIGTPITVPVRVNRARLEARADNAVREQGMPNPQFTISYSGFVYGETESVFDSPPVAEIGVRLSSFPYEYEIRVLGGYAPNYEIVRISGALTVVAGQSLPTAFIPGNTEWPWRDSKYEVQIFNRLGVLIYEGENGWDGRNMRNGNLVEPGIYFYISTCPEGVVRRGTIEVIRMR